MRHKGYIYYEKREKCWYARVTLTDKNGKRRNLKNKAGDKTDAQEKLKVLTRQIEDESVKVIGYQKTFLSRPFGTWIIASVRLRRAATTT